jgi:hypothetical protein
MAEREETREGVEYWNRVADMSRRRAAEGNGGT